MAHSSKQTLHDDMVSFLRERPDGVSAHDLALNFLKLKNAPQKIADAAIGAILAGDRRVFAGDDGLWRATQGGAGNEENLRSLPWSAVYCCIDPQSGRALHFSSWDLQKETPRCTRAAWLCDPQFLPYDEGELLRSGADLPFDGGRIQQTLSAFAVEAAERIPLFLLSGHRKQLSILCAGAGENLPDDTVLVRDLLKASGRVSPRPLDLALFEKAVLGTEQRGAGARKQGERFADAILDLFELLKHAGIETRTALDDRLTRDKAPLFAGKAFSYDTILSLPSAPGVYAFKDAGGMHCYIGKAKNLKRRLQSYWNDGDESPEKIGRLREMAHTLVTHQCGSELECLLYEYRLIRKYTPPLNTMTGIAERKGTYSPVDDCIVLLPHAETGKGMSVWIRKNQKLLLKPFDGAFPAENGFTADLAAFFMSPALPAASTDFPELEIASRWIKKHADSLVMVPVSRMADAGEVYDAVKSSWREFSESRSGHARQ
jgi:hypothetical protein